MWGQLFSNVQLYGVHDNINEIPVNFKPVEIRCGLCGAKVLNGQESIRLDDGRIRHKVCFDKSK